MKKIKFMACGFFILGLGAAGPVFAGLPDQDPIVEMLRERFEIARTPTLQELKLGKTWVCKQYSADKDAYETWGPGELWNFATFGGIIQNTKHNMLYSEFVFSSEGLVSAVLSDFRLYLRISDQGDLLYEFTTSDTSYGLRAPSISNSSSEATGYGICPADQVKN